MALYDCVKLALRALAILNECIEWGGGGETGHSWNATHTFQIFRLKAERDWNRERISYGKAFPLFVWVFQRSRMSSVWQCIVPLSRTNTNGTFSIWFWFLNNVFFRNSIYTWNIEIHFFHSYYFKYKIPRKPKPNECMVDCTETSSVNINFYCLKNTRCPIANVNDVLICALFMCTIG